MQTVFFSKTLKRKQEKNCTNILKGSAKKNWEGGFVYLTDGTV